MDAPEIPPLPRVKWEYRIADISKHDAEDVLNEWWGPRGWELVHCEFGANAFGCVFKRRAY